ncbi:MAG: DSD1 family PLP-dependent enzyme [Alphaproteobacteria bacterium]|jgi:D-serine deaminase-like pyridoxal phosphate-dependent protein|nr:DSD1 family PLP-dependent enzyme [Alphaproteobacteria bacterium]
MPKVDQKMPRIDETPTPALVLDLDILESNIAAMTAWAKQHGIGLRPHAKTHKCATISQRQLEAGALGLCCTKVGEAEALAAAGITRIAITAPVLTPARIRRLMDLNRQIELTAVVDEMGNADDLAAAAEAAGKPLKVLIDVDVGTHRTGVTSAATAVTLAALIDGRQGLELGGLQGYAGHVQHVQDYRIRKIRTERDLQVLAEARDALRQAGFEVAVISGGGTGSHRIDAGMGLLTEVQVGSYVFCDVDYDVVDLTGDGSRPYRNSLFVDLTVISANHPGFATVDGGYKNFATDGPVPEVTTGAPAGTSYRFFGDHFGRLEFADTYHQANSGERVRCIVSHCDPTINLYDSYTCVRGDEVVEHWPIEGRGRGD